MSDDDNPDVPLTLCGIVARRVTWQVAMMWWSGPMPIRGIKHLRDRTRCGLLDAWRAYQAWRRGERPVPLNGEPA